MSLLGNGAAPLKRVLLTNDDGWGAPGLEAMARVLAGLEGVGEILIVTPPEERSAASHAITLHGPIEAEEVEHPVATAALLVHGTPADCAKLAITTLFRDDPPALAVSGLNRGPNVGVNVFYSGTVGAALEAVINNVPAVAVSKEFGEKLGFDDAARLIMPLLKETLARGLPPWHALNVNIPDLALSDIRGLKLTRQGVSGFEEWYREEPCDAARLSSPKSGGRRSFMIDGEMKLRETDGTTDAEALSAGYVSVTPLALDLTARGLVHAGAKRYGWGWLAEIGLAPG